MLPKYPNLPGESVSLVLWILGLLLLGTYWVYDAYMKVQCYRCCQCWTSHACENIRKSRMTIFKVVPPQLSELKLWLYMWFSFWWASWVLVRVKDIDTDGYQVVPDNATRGWDVQPKNISSDVNTLVTMFLASLTFTLSTVLTSSLQKHADSIRLFEVYTGDIIAFTMEVVAFLESVDEPTLFFDWTNAEQNTVQGRPEQDIGNANEDFQHLKCLSVAMNLLNRMSGKSVTQKIWPLTDIPGYPHARDSGDAYATRATFMKELLLYLSDIRELDGVKANAKSDAIVKKMKKAVSRIQRDRFPSIQKDREKFLYTLQRIFEIAYALPQVTKREFRRSDWVKKRFDVKKLNTLNINYQPEYSTKDSKTVAFKNSSIWNAYIQFDQAASRRLSEKEDGLSPTQTFFMVLLDFINELHRCAGTESQTRRTLNTAWRRLYGTYGDMATIRTYQLPRVVRVSMEFGLMASCFALPYSGIRGVFDDVQIMKPLACALFQFFFVGLYVSSVRVRNAYVSSENAVGFENVSATAQATQNAVAQIWEARGIIQQYNPIQYLWNTEEAATETPIVNPMKDLRERDGIRF